MSFIDWNYLNNWPHSREWKKEIWRKVVGKQFSRSIERTISVCVKNINYFEYSLRVFSPRYLFSTNSIEKRANIIDMSTIMLFKWRMPIIWNGIDHLSLLSGVFFLQSLKVLCHRLLPCVLWSSFSPSLSYWHIMAWRLFDDDCESLAFLYNNKFPP